MVEKQVSTTLAFKYFPINMLSFFYYNTNYNTETTDVATIGSNIIIIITFFEGQLLVFLSKVTKLSLENNPSVLGPMCLEFVGIKWNIFFNLCEITNIKR